MYDDDDEPPVTPSKSNVSKAAPPSPQSTLKTALPKTPTTASWADVALTFQPLALWPPGAVTLGPSWLIAGSGGVGCAACHPHQSKLLLVASTSWASMNVRVLRRSNIRRHATSASHRSAVAAYLGLEIGPRGLPVVGAPSLSEFASIEELMSKGNHAPRSTKTTLMMWCIGECLAQRDRNFLKTATSISLTRDARRQRLLIRWSAVNKNLEMRSGLLGISVNDGDSAGDVAAGTRRILQIFCTERWRPPRGFVGRRKDLNADLFEYISRHVEIITSDAAPNEILASDVARGRRALAIETGTESGPISALFPGMVVVGRDHAHGFRRLAVVFFSRYTFSFNVEIGQDPIAALYGRLLLEGSDDGNDTEQTLCRAASL